MLEWINWAADCVKESARMDGAYLELAEKQKALLPEFEALLAELSEDNRALLLEYMDVCGDLDERRVQLAYFLGKKYGARTE